MILASSISLSIKSSNGVLASTFGRAHSSSATCRGWVDNGPSMSSGLTTFFSASIVPIMIAYGGLKRMEFTCSITRVANMNSNISGNHDKFDGRRQMMRE
jgi:hypothetical protein